MLDDTGGPTGQDFWRGPGSKETPRDASANYRALPVRPQNDIEQNMGQKMTRPLPVRPLEIDPAPNNLSSEAWQPLDRTISSKPSAQWLSRCGFGEAALPPSRSQLIKKGVTLGVIALFLFIFIPRYPTWEVIDIQFSTFQLPMYDFEGGLDHLLNWNFPNRTSVRVSLVATVRATNPNPVGAITEPGQFDIFYEGVMIGRANTGPLHVPGWGSFTAKIPAVVDGVPAKLGIKMAQYLQEHDMQMPVTVKGGVVAQVFKRFRVLALVRCFLRTDASFLPQKVVFSEKACDYTIDVPKNGSLTMD